MFPGQDPYLWDNCYSAIEELVKDLVKTVHQRGPVSANRSMLNQIVRIVSCELHAVSGRILPTNLK